jgi:hypothetical protein
MKGCWIRILGTGALVISAFGQTGVGLQAPAINSVLGTVSPDKSSITAILETEVALQPGPGCLLRASEPYASGFMRFRFLSTAHQMLDDQPQEETEPVSEVQVSGDTLVVSTPDSSPDVPAAIAKYPGLNAAEDCRDPSANCSTKSSSAIADGTTHEQSLGTHRDYFERAVRYSSGAQTRGATGPILEPLVVANARLQTEIYTILTIRATAKA